MELTDKQYRRISGLLPVQRGNVQIENRTLLNALIYRCENGRTDDRQEPRGLEHQNTRPGNGRRVAGVSLSAGNVTDAEAGRLLLETAGHLEETADMLMDWDYEDYKNAADRLVAALSSGSTAEAEQDQAVGL